ncbi:MAG: hypothetical protein H8E15_14740 [Planctomycetes bacterium]|nr:hypothetical protein [Planctomycetota bacterium]
MKLYFLSVAIMSAAIFSPLCGQNKPLRPMQDAETDSHLKGTQGDQGNTAGKFNWFSLNSNFWHRSRAGGAFIDGSFFLVGGEMDSLTYGTSRAKTVEIFDPFTLTWRSSLVEMAIGVSNISGGVAAVDDNIYVFGGWKENSTRSNNIQVYNTTTDSWSIHATTMPEAIYGCIAVAVDQNRIFVCGGSQNAGFGGAATDNAYFFDTMTGTITPTTPMTAARFLHSADVVDSTVYVAAGYGTGTAFESFNSATETWTTLPSLPVDRAGCGIAAVGDYCVFFGGDWSGYRDDCDVYDSVAGAFDAGLSAKLGTMPLGKRSFAYADIQLPWIRALAAMDGWRTNNYTGNCTVLL